MPRCFFCGADISLETKIFRTSLCASCGGDLKICRNCRFYSPGSHWDCSETISEAVRDKERANFCDFFVLDPHSSGKPAAKKDQDAIRRSFNNLFNDE